MSNKRNRLRQKLGNQYGTIRKQRYIYESHHGGLYCTDDELDDLYCDTCGDSDWFIGIAYSKTAAKRLILKESPWGDNWTKEYLKRFLDENFCEKYIVEV